MKESMTKNKPNLRDRYGLQNRHNGVIPRHFWLEDWEKQAIINYHIEHPDEGYRRLTFMMLDEDIVAKMIKEGNGEPDHSIFLYMTWKAFQSVKSSCSNA